MNERRTILDKILNFDHSKFRQYMIPMTAILNVPIAVWSLPDWRFGYGFWAPYPALEADWSHV